MLMVCILVMSVHEWWTSERLSDRIVYVMLSVACVAEGVARLWRGCDEGTLQAATYPLW